MHQFITRMFLRSAVNASLQHVKTYIDGTSDRQKQEYRESLKDWLQKFSLRYYVWEYDEVKYCEEIVNLKEYLLNHHGNILTGLTIGICQKPIALYLKYLWLSGDQSKKPLFATIDQKILMLANIPDPPNWTEIDSVEEYSDIVCLIDEHAKQNGFGTGSVWEAESWTDYED